MNEHQENSPDWVQINQVIEAFESEREKSSGVDFANFLPPRASKIYLKTLTELIRVDMEYAWQQRPSPLEDYVDRFPELRFSPRLLKQLASEEYRQRRELGETPAPEEYRVRFGIKLVEEDSSENQRYPVLPEQYPPLGEEFLGFHLLHIIGRGAFSQVYLARQGDLAGRLVALKVSRDLSNELQTLAQLQHTHITPIYSVHRTDTFDVCCMPYFGSKTLQDFLIHLNKKEQLPTKAEEYFAFAQEKSNPQQIPKSLKNANYIDTVLWIGKCLADGLAHAHHRGVLHLDLKPANILLTEEGQPMLLDFNLAVQEEILTEEQSGRVGGTIPYMAPEQIERLMGEDRTLDGRADVYSLGIILYQLLTLKYPFPIPQITSLDCFSDILSDRSGQKPKLRCHNPHISPATEAIIQHCLAPNRNDRYLSAFELSEDIERQLHHQKLRHTPDPSWLEQIQKWDHSQPRLLHTSTLAIAALAVLTAFGTILWYR